MKQNKQIVMPEQLGTLKRYNIGETQQYPELDRPFRVQAQVQPRNSEDEHLSTYALNYCGRDIITISVDKNIKHRYRKHSDGNMQSSPFIQQFFFTVEEAATISVKIHTKADAYSVRPRRAENKEAIMGQVGHPLIYGANGFYAVWEDMLMAWNGMKDWTWSSSTVEVMDDGSVVAQFEARLSTRPFVINLFHGYYQDHLGYKYHKSWERTPNPKAITGWTSWEAYHMKVTQSDMEEAAAFMSPLKAFGLEYIQLDDGFEQMTIPPSADEPVWHSWIQINEKFPDNHAGIVEAIRKQGLEPGIWTNTLINQEEAAKNGLAILENGEPFIGDWIVYTMDPTEENLEKHIVPYYRKLREAGYSYFKTDAIRHLIFDGLQEAVRRGILTDEQVDTGYRRFFEYARREIGDNAYFLSCWGHLTQVAGLYDACRVGTDADPQWGSIHMQILETARWYFAQRNLFTLDPDHICVRTELPWARLLLSVVSLSGGLLMLSDPISTYDADRISLIERTIPALETRTAEIAPVDYTIPAFCRPYDLSRDIEEVSRDLLHLDADEDGDRHFATLWATHFAKNGREWTTVTRAGLITQPAASIDLLDLGLDPKVTYLVYDFWAEKYLGQTTGSLNVAELQVGDVQVLSLTPLIGNKPILISSSRHVSMDAVSVKHFQATDTHIALSLLGVAGRTFDYIFYTDAQLSVKSASNCDVEIAVDGSITKVSIHYLHEEAELILSYQA